MMSASQTGRGILVGALICENTYGCVTQRKTRAHVAFIPPAQMPHIWDIDFEVTVDFLQNKVEALSTLCSSART